jgi:hypothetical protein
MDKKQTDHSLHDCLFFVLLFGFVALCTMSELRYQISRLWLPFQYWGQLMYSYDPITREYFYSLINGKS